MVILLVGASFQNRELKWGRIRYVRYCGHHLVLVTSFIWISPPGSRSVVQPTRAGRHGGDMIRTSYIAEAGIKDLHVNYNIKSPAYRYIPQFADRGGRRK